MKSLRVKTQHNSKSSETIDTISLAKREKKEKKGQLERRLLSSRSTRTVVTLIYVYSYARKVVGKMCTRQSRKVIWDMINTLFLTTVPVEPTFVSFSTRKHISTAFRTNSYKFL